MKKRLLISSVLMSAVLACALGTGTYAWYAASTSGSVSVSNTTGGSITTKEAPSITKASMTCAITATETVDLSNDDGESYYIVSGKAVQNNAADVTAAGSYVLSFVGDDADAKRAAAGSYTLTLTGTEGAVLCLTENGEYSATITFAVVVDADGNISTGGTGDFYYAVRAANPTTEGTNLVGESTRTGVITASLA